MSSKQSLSDTSKRHVLISRSCIALVLQKISCSSDASASAAKQPEDGHCIFADFLQQNSMCFWNACLTRSVASLEYRGCLVPSTLLISGTDFALEVVRSAWARRVLRPPKGYSIGKLGDIGVVEMVPVSQTQFAPLSEALCKVVADLNGEGVQASTATIRVKLEDNFPEMQVPAEDILYKTLGGLIKERKIYHTGNGYFVVSPETYRHRAVSPVCERQMLMTNEEAIVKLHGGCKRECSLAVQVDEMDIAAAWKCSSSAFLHASSQRNKDVSCQISQVPPSPDLQYLERSHSLKILRMKRRPKSSEGADRGGSFKETKRLSYLANELNENIQDLPKNEKQSVLAKILKRMQSLTDKSTKHVSFSAQFPPLEWLDSGRLQGHSVATQTLLHKVDPKANVKRIEPSCPKIPWEDVEGRGFTYYFTSNGVPRSTFVETDSNKHKNASVLMRQGSSRHSPSHRYSHGSFSNYAKRRQRHRRSSSESPKIHKTTSNGHRNSSPGSKSPTDQSDAKLSFSSSSGSANPKAIVNPRLQTLDHPHSGRANIYASNTLPPNWESRCNSSPLRAPESKQVKNSPTYSPKRAPLATSSPKCPAESKLDKDLRTYSPKLPRPVQNVNVSRVPPTQTQINGKESRDKSNLRTNLESEDDHSISRTLSDAKLAMSESFSDTSVSCNGVEHLKKKSIEIKPLVLKSFVDNPKSAQGIEKKSSSPPKEITVDNSVSVEVALQKSPQPSSKKNNISTTVVTEETTVTKENGNSKVVTVTSITTSLSHGGIKDIEKPSPDKSSVDNSVSSEKQKSSVNDLNIETVKGSRIIDCSSSCNIVTEVK